MNLLSPIFARETAPEAAPRQPSARSARGLDWFVFFLADVQTGFGPFVTVYLTTQHWTQGEIGLILSIAGVIALLGQIPGGALVDWARSERLLAGVAIALIGVSAIACATWPTFPIVLAAVALQAASSCVLGPAIAAISLGLVGRSDIERRLGRNARFASIGSVFAAAGMGAFGYLLSSRSVFIVAAVLTIPTIVAIASIRGNEIAPDRAHGSVPGAGAAPSQKAGIAMLVRNRPLLAFALVVLLFQLANAAVLPLVGGFVALQSGTWAPALIAACMIMPQIIVAAASPWVSRRAQWWGRRPLLMLGIGALVLRVTLFAFLREPYMLVIIQVLDGISAAVFGVLVPLIIVDVTYGSGRFNLAQGFVGTAIGVGASISVLFAGYSSDRFGINATFLVLAAVAVIAFALVWFVMPETRPPAAERAEPGRQDIAPAGKVASDFAA